MKHVNLKIDFKVLAVNTKKDFKTAILVVFKDAFYFFNMPDAYQKVGLLER